MTHHPDTMKLLPAHLVRLMAAWLVTGILGALSARADLLAFDSFEDYATGNIHGQTGGTGWSGAWAVQAIGSGGTGTAAVSATEITYNHGGVILGGGKSLQLTTASNGTRRNVLPAVNTGGGDYYVSFLFRYAGTVFAGWQALDGSPDVNNDSIGLVNTNGSVGARVDNNTGSSAAGLVPANTTCLMVMRFTGWTGTNYSTVSLWVNPAAGGQPAGAASATYTDTTPADGGGSAGFLGVYVRTIIDSGESVVIDDLRVGTDWASVTSLQPAAAEPPAPSDWFLRLDQTGSDSWLTASAWTVLPDGSGGSPTTTPPGDIFDINNHYLRSPFVNSTCVFPGSELRISGAAGTLALKTYGGATSVYDLVVGRGGRVLNLQGGVQNIRFVRFENETGLRFWSATDRSLNLSSDVMLGAGETRVVNGGMLRLAVADADDYVGNIVVESGKLDFGAPFSSGAAVVVESGGVVHLNNSATVAGLVARGKTLTEGTHTFAELQAWYPAVFPVGVQTASLTVRAPLVWHLETDQAPGHDWSTAGDWNSLANGTGEPALFMNRHDIYAVEGAGRRVRTPAAASTFPGSVLALGSGARLSLQSPAGAVSAVPAIATNGTVSITQGLTGIVQTLSVGDWEIGSGTTSLAIGPANGLDLTIDRLSGAGTLQTQSAGTFNLAVIHGADFTGTLSHPSGALTLEGRVFTKGALNVGAGASLVLEGSGYFSGVAVAGTPLAAGFHSQSALHAAFPAQFPVGTAGKFLAVYNPDVTGPAHMFGVNLAGAEFERDDKSVFPGTYGKEWKYPTAAEFKYYNEKGLNLIRIPFRWERMQVALGNGALDPAELARMDEVVGFAAARGMKVILDMHNYARWVPGPYHDGHLIGTGPVTIAHFAEVWRLLANHYKGNATIYGYGIMNEPYSTNGTWPAIAQAAVDAIRTVDLTTYVIVGGDSFSNARDWRVKNPNLDIKDPVGRLIYEAHCYFDANNSGQYDESYDVAGGHPMLGVERVTEFVEWLQEKGAKGFIGEYGVPGEDPRWLDVLRNFLAYLDTNGVSGTYWAGGPWWGTYRLTCEPTNNFTVDRPQMSVLRLDQ